MIHTQMHIHIVSCSDQTELRELCRQLGIAHFFKSIQGSPTPKKQLVQEVLDRNQYEPDNCVLIGDSINDWEASEANKISFMGYNNPSIEKFCNLQLF